MIMCEESFPGSNMLTEPLLGSSSKGGLKTLPFIITNEAFEKVASYGVLPNMIMYLMGSYGMKLATASTIIYNWSAATSLAPVVGAFLADSYVGRFWMIGYGSFFSLLGMVLLWLTAIIPSARPCDDSGSECTSTNFFQLALLASSLGIMSIGAGGIRSSSLAFGTDQVLNKGITGNTEGLLERFFNWYNFAAAAGTVAALTLVVYIQDNFGWKVGFGFPVFLMLLSTLSFFLASPLYIKFKAEAGSPIMLAQVLIATWKKRHLHISCSVNHDLYYQKKDSNMSMPCDKLRFLNKACMIENAEEELTKEGKAKNPWSLCTIDQVEELKALIKVIPIWSTGIVMSMKSYNPFSVLLAQSMDRHIAPNFEIPAGSFGAFTIISSMLWIAMYDLIIIPVATIIKGRPVLLSPRTRIGIGLVLSFVTMAIQAIVEGARRDTAIKEGFSDHPNGVTTMSAIWLLPSLWISGMAEAFFIIGANEFFCSEFPRSMFSVATNLNGIGMSLSSVIASLMLNTVNYITSLDGRESWVSSNINKAHFDYYYWIISALCLINFFYFLLCNDAYGNSSTQLDREEIGEYLHDE